MSGSDMAIRFGVNKSVVNKYMHKNGLTAPHELIIKFRTAKLIGLSILSKKEDALIKRKYLTVPIKRLADQMGRGQGVIRRRIGQLGLIIPNEIIKKRKVDSQIKKGNVPLNKGRKMKKSVYKKCAPTMFKKGHLPANTKPRNGVITIRHDHKKRKNPKPYKYIRIAIGKWYPLHQYKWEKKYGKVPKGYCLWFKDGNSLKPYLNNLELITRAEDMRRNTIHRYPMEVKKAIRINSKLKKKIREHEKQAA
jgi:hypothetical protein